MFVQVHDHWTNWKASRGKTAENVSHEGEERGAPSKKGEKSSIVPVGTARAKGTPRYQSAGWINCLVLFLPASPYHSPLMSPPTFSPNHFLLVSSPSLADLLTPAALHPLGAAACFHLPFRAILLLWKCFKRVEKSH